MMIQFEIPTVSKRFTKTLWDYFVSGNVQVSSSGLTAAILADEAQKAGVGYVLKFHPDHQAYTIQMSKEKS